MDVQFLFGLISTIAAVVAIAASIVGGLNWLKKRAAEKGEFEIAGDDWVISNGMTHHALLQRLIGLDHSVLPGLGERSEGSIDQWAPVFGKSPETWSLVVFRDRVIVGYWSFFSISNKLHNLLRSGKLYDSRLVESEVRNIHEAGPHNLYFVMIASHPDYSRSGGVVFKLLMESLGNTVQKLIDENVEVSEILTNAVSEQGKLLCTKLGFKPMASSVQGGEVYQSALTAELVGKLTRLSGTR